MSSPLNILVRFAMNVTPPTSPLPGLRFWGTQAQGLKPLATVALLLRSKNLPMRHGISRRSGWQGCAAKASASHFVPVTLHITHVMWSRETTIIDQGYSNARSLHIT